MNVIFCTFLILATATFFYTFVWLALYIVEGGKSTRTKKLTKAIPVSIIVPAYNEEGKITKCIASLLNLNYPKYEIIVVDDGSTDNTSKKVADFIKERKLGKKVKLVVHKRNKGKAAAVNTGIKNARYPLIAVVDADSHVTKDSLIKIVPYFYDEEVGAVASTIKVRNPNNLLAKLQWWEYLLVNFYRSLMSRINVLYVTPGVMSVYRKQHLEKVGLFDENEISEDLEIALRLKKHNYKILFEIDSITYTDVPSTLKGFYRQRVRWYRGFLRNFKRYWKTFGFSKTYDLFGTFMFPMALIGVAVWMFHLIIVLVNWLDNVYWSFVRIKLLGFTFFTKLTLQDFILSQNYPYLYIYSIWILTAIYFIIKARSALKIRKKYLKEFIVFLTLYPLMLGACWLVSFIQEFAGVRRKW